MKRLKAIFSGICLALFLMLATAPAVRVYADDPGGPQGGSNSGPRPTGAPPPTQPPPSVPPSPWIPPWLWDLLNT